MATQKISGYAPVNGLNMYYEIHGEGPMPLVLIHGGGSTIESTFGIILPLLVTGYKIIAVELQAHGRTGDRDAPESFEQDADDVAALLKYLQIDKANFSGFSNGGSTTMQIAIRHPQLVNKIVVIAGAYKRDGFIQGFFDGFGGVTLANMPKSLQDAYLKVAPDKNGLQVMFDKDVQRMVNFKDWPDDDLRSIKAAALIINAQHDVIIPQHAVEIANLIPNAQLAILPGIHGAFIGAAEANAKKGGNWPTITAALIKEFLNE
jgi:pimeloyl-ACP methyl ester carboxylesterase